MRRFLWTAGMALALAGCQKEGQPAARVEPAAPAEAEDEVAAERAKLSPEDRALVEAQEWCANSTNERLGAMGPPIKLDIEGRPVFVCCRGCKKKVEAAPEKTLATVEELKAKKKSATAPPVKPEV